MILKLAYKFLALAFICFMSSASSFAHKANEAFFNFQELDSTVYVHVELPWSIRQVLLDYDKSLNESSNESNYLNSLKTYFQEKLILRKATGHKLEIISFRFLPQQGHNHQNDFELIYKGINLSSIENNLFTSYFKNQKNYHQDITTTKRYTTDSFKTSFYIGEIQQSASFESRSYIKIVRMILFLTSLFIPGLLIVKYKKTKTTRVHQTDIIHNVL